MILIINTSDIEEVTIGLIDQGKVLALKNFRAKYRQAEKLLPSIDKLLKNAKVNLKDINGIVVADGPGPFSALRIGIALANTLGFALRIPVMGVKKERFSNPAELAAQAEKLIKQASVENIVLPFYGKEPNITIKP
ncbi:MAG: tRNA (adenosine(37)-N6)-threonylcarbamoyltransferase complex dimerization subunit type 1 TsaB [Patescibacteria group bacterium]|nr:tRNA (adenosine(37)-N6)-threonylcarbamoyltransferase complex dimerization subunit type 1 TsaB [Patescibacteria group bacterium]